MPAVADEVASHGKTVICAGLDGDINRNKFGYLIDLIPMAEKVKKMQAICVKCGTTASFTQRHTIEDDTQKDTIVIVGGVEMYRPVCRVCYNDALWSNSDSGKISVHSGIGNEISTTPLVPVEKINATRPAMKTNNLGKKRLAMHADGIPTVEKLQDETAKEAGTSTELKAKKLNSDTGINSALTRKVTTESLDLSSPQSGSPPGNVTDKK